MGKTKNGRLALSSKCAVCGSKKIKIYERTKSRGLLSNLGIKTPLRKNSIIRRSFVLNYWHIK